MGALADVANDTSIRAEALALLAEQGETDRRIDRTRKTLARARNNTIDRARAHGASWEDIGNAIGGIKPNTARMRHERGI